ncbi:MAG: glycosyltransferase [Bacteroidetes bacterium]|nr:glycosyltransferase [Bacteroidota bacterium]MDA1120300.1 glycosyltransferase [Bacteroidota bacterium]
MQSIAGPKVTVVIPTYNSSHTLQYAIQSLLNQSFKDFEAWIIGDACTDDSSAVVSSFQDKRLNWCNLSENSGSQPAPSNEGIRRARGTYIGYLEHDDLLMPRHLELLMKCAESGKSDFVFSVTVELSPSGIDAIRAKRPIGVSKERYFTPPSSWMHKKSLVNSIGYWDENYLKLLENPDKAYFTRLLLNSKATLLPRFTVLKFPSHLWKSYLNKQALTDALKTNCEKLIKDPIQFELDLLNQGVTESSKVFSSWIILPPKQCLHMLLRYFYVPFRSTFKRNFLFHLLFNKIYIHKRKKSSKRRGL